MLIFIITIFLSQGNGNINIHISTCNNITLFRYEGAYVQELTDFEIQRFNITDDNLKNAATKYLGRRPDNIFIRNPTPNSDIFKKYKWKEVSRIIKIANVKMIKRKERSVNILTHNIINNSSKEKVLDTDILQRVKNKVKTTWINGNFDAYHDIKGHFKVNFKDSTVEFNLRWGEDVFKENSVEIGTKNGGRVKLKPGASVTSKLIASRVQVRLQIDYEVRLGGVVVTTFRRKYGKHYFWSIPTENVLLYGDIDPVIRARQYVDLDYYCDSNLLVFDNGRRVELDLI